MILGEFGMVLPHVSRKWRLSAPKTKTHSVCLAANSRIFGKIRFAPDSPLEGKGFELSVPPWTIWGRDAVEDHQRRANRALAAALLTDCSTLLVRFLRAENSAPRERGFGSLFLRQGVFLCKSISRLQVERAAFAPPCG